MGGGTFFKVGGTSARHKNYVKFMWFELAIVTSQALKYNVLTYAPYEGLSTVCAHCTSNKNQHALMLFNGNRFRHTASSVQVN